VISTGNGGEEYFLGNTIEITWTSTRDESFVKIEFSIDNGVNWKTVVDSTINDHLYLWTITDWVDAKWLMRISHTSDPSINDISNGPFIVVVHPDDQDADTDGFSVNEGDCNDSNDAVYPGAIEICDQVDNNCNGLVNENLDCRGDINADGVVDLVDVILSLQILTHTTPQSNITLTGDVDNDQNIGVAEAIYGLRSAAEL